MMNYSGRWRVTVIGKDASWAQRVVITGASAGGGVLAGTVGATRVVDGDHWSLDIEHDDGQHGWQPNTLQPDPVVEAGTSLSQVVRSKDVFRPGDSDPNDLVVRVEKVGPMFELTVRPYAVDVGTLMMLPDGIFVNVNGLQLMAAEVRNTWGRAFHADTTFDVSGLGRATLASFGILVRDAWPPRALAAAQQQQLGSGMVLPPLGVGEKFTLFFLVDASGARQGKPAIEFVLRRASGDPDPSNGMRFNRRPVFVAEVGFDGALAQAVALVPEGRLTLRLRAVAVSPAVVQRLCRDVRGAIRGARGTGPSAELARFLALARSGNMKGCDAGTLREILKLLCRCLLGEDGGGCHCDGGDGGGGGGRGDANDLWRCLGGAIWLPLKFEYAVEINGGFVGQHGPLAFQDPWWKVVLLVLAFLAWLVGLIASIAGDAGYGVFATDKPKKIGTVGASSLNNVDAALIELDGSRSFQQAVVDALTGETNTTSVVGMDTIVPIDPQAAAAFVGMLVYKSGARTGLTHGVVTAINAPVTICRGELESGVCTPDPNHPNQNLSGQILIASDPAIPEEQFSDHGDSGSIVLSREPATMNQVVGLLYGGIDTSTDVSPIQDVLDELQLNLRP